MPNELSEHYSIGELARQAGIAPSAVRFYESRGLLQSERTEGGQRRYGPEAVLSLKQIAFAQASGFTLTEIANLLGPMQSGEPIFGHWRDLAEKKLIELDQIIEQAHETKRRLHQALNCRCTAPEDCGLLDQAVCEDQNPSGNTAIPQYRNTAIP